MTDRKHLKQLVRTRMQRTGEAYTTARRHVIRDNQAVGSSPRQHHFPGNTPGPTALRALLAGAGVVAPHTKQPFSEAMVFGIAGGIGAGVFAFHYAKENFSSFFIAGRHQWQDTKSWTLDAAKRFGVTAIVKESSGAGPAEKQLRGLLQDNRPVMIWLDFRGKQYHVVTVHGIDDSAGTAQVGDLSDDFFQVSLTELAAARGRTKKDKNRAVALEPAGELPPLKQMVHEGIAACVTSLTSSKMKNFRLDAFKSWADKLDGKPAPDSWEEIFPSGGLFFMGLRSITEYIEYYATGGGLSRPLFAEFLSESSTALKDPGLAKLSEKYAELGRGWSALADAALPDNVPLFQQAKQLLEQKAEAGMNQDNTATSGVDHCAKAIAQVQALMKDGFPLSDAESAALRRDLKKRVMALYEGEVAALDALKAWL